MRRRWPCFVGCGVIPAALIALLVLASIGTTLVPPVLTGLFPPTAAELVGTRTCRYPYATETLTFRPDGVCVQRIAFNSGQIISNSGRWSFNPSRCDLQLTDLTVVDNGFGAPTTRLAPTSALWGPMVRRSMTGSVYLVVNEDVSLFLE